MSLGTATLGINDAQPRNFEAPRSVDLLPDQIRPTATVFTSLLTEYYKFLNIAAWTTSTVSLNSYTLTSATGTVLTGLPGSGPTNIIYSILSQLDVDNVEEDYLTHIQAAVAPYVPVPSYMSTTSTYTVNAAPYYKYLSSRERSYLRAQLYRKIIRYFYNTRGARNSAISFFKLFYNDLASIFDWNDYPSVVTEHITNWLTLSGMSISATSVSAGSIVYGQTPVQAWTPFTYVITTGLTGATPTFSLPAVADIPYRALVHPVGFKYFIQPTGISGIVIEQSDSRMDRARNEYQEALWFMDAAELREYGNFTIFDAAAIGHNPSSMRNTTIGTVSAYSYAEWSNLGAIAQYRLATLTTTPANVYTLSIASLSSLNIVSGMLVSGTSSFGNSITSTATVAYTTASVNTVSGIITLLTSLSSSLPAGTPIIFSPGKYKYPN